MNVVDVHEINPGVKMVSFQDTAMFLNLFYKDLVEELLECFTEFTDYDIIEELVDSLDLNIIAVVEQSAQGLLVHGYIKGGALA